MISNSALVVSLPVSFQGKVGSCSPSPCTTSTTLVIYTSLSGTSIGSILTVNLLNVVNPYTLGLTTSLTIYTLYDSSVPTSIV